MSVSVRWVLAQPELALRRRSAEHGLDRSITFVVTTELEDPSRWLSGGELMLTTGIRLPLTSADREEYLRGLVERNVAALGFGTGLSHQRVPQDLIDAADRVGLPLLEVPLATPFAAVAKRVMARLAELQYEEVLRVSRALPRMARAVVQGGVRAAVRELATAVSGTALVADATGRIVECQPHPLDAATKSDVLGVLADSGSSATSFAAVGASGTAISRQRIGVGQIGYGSLVVVSPAPLTHMDQVLLGHANALLALDFEKPARLASAQNTLNSQALGLVLGAGQDLRPAWAHLGDAADGKGDIRVLTVLPAAAADAERIRTAVAEGARRAGRPLFVHVTGDGLVAVLRGADGAEFASTLVAGVPSGLRKTLRAGLSAIRPLAELPDAVELSRVAASAAEAGGAPLQLAGMAGNALLSAPETRTVLNAVAAATIEPLAAHDARTGGELVASLHAFLEANGHWESAAAALGVHRHTLRNRVGKIEALLECDLDVARVRAELLLAVIAHRSDARND